MMLTSYLSELSYIIKCSIAFVLIITGVSFFAYANDNMDIRQITKEFTENVQKEGYIDLEMYETFMKEISVQKVTIEFEYTYETRDFAGRKINMYVSKKQIIDELYNNPDHIFKMQKYGNFKVKVYSNGDIFSGILGKVTNHPELFRVITSKGGMIYRDPN